MSGRTVEAHGRLGVSAYFDGSLLRLTRTSRAVAGRGQRDIPIGQLSGVEWRDAGWVTDGYIRFVLAGVLAPRLRTGVRTTQVANDEWAIPFRRKHQGDMELLRDAVRAALGQR